MTIVQNIGLALVFAAILGAFACWLAGAIYGTLAAWHRQPWAPWMNVASGRVLHVWSEESRRREEAYFTEKALPYIRRARQCLTGFLLSILTFLLGVAIIVLGA